MTDDGQHLTRFVLNVTGFALIISGFFLNMTGFVQNVTSFCPKYDGIRNRYDRNPISSQLFPDIFSCAVLDVLGSVRMELITWWEKNRELKDENGLGVLGSVRMELITWWEQNRELKDENGLGVLGSVKMELVKAENKQGTHKLELTWCAGVSRNGAGHMVRT